MIVGFSKHGTGASTGPIQYLTGTHSPDDTLRQPAPVVLRGGDPALVGRLIDSLDFKHKYTSGVLSFAPGEVITPAMEERICTAFERIAFAGLERDQYSILWVRHTHAGHHELNFLIPRVELSTGKSLNIAPPGKASRELFDTFRSLINAEYGLADPEDVTRTRDLTLPHHLARLRADTSRKGEALDASLREAITEHVRREVDAGRIKDRDGVEAYIAGQGYTITRAAEHYITVEIDPNLPPHRGRIRLKGGLYDREQFNPRDTRYQQVRYDVPDPERAAELAAKLERLTAARAKYHQERYGRPGERSARQRTPGGPDLPIPGEALPDYLTRTLGDEAILPHQDGGTPARSTQRRQRRRRMQQAAEAIERGASDRPGTTVDRSPQTPRGAVRGPRAGDAGGHESLARARGALEQATQRLESAGRKLVHATRAFRGFATAHIDEQWFLRVFYGEGRAR
jgi:hypothetical protein